MQRLSDSYQVGVSSGSAVAPGSFGGIAVSIETVSNSGLSRGQRSARWLHWLLNLFVAGPLATGLGWMLSNVQGHIQLLSGEVRFGHPDYEAWRAELRVENQQGLGRNVPGLHAEAR